MLNGLYYRDAPEKIEERVNQSFHLFRDLLITVTGGNAGQEALDAFYEKAEEVYQTAREIIRLQLSDKNYATAHVKAGVDFHVPLFDAIHDYNPGVSDPILEKILDQLGCNYDFIIARPTARRWDLSLINTQTSLDIISVGIDCHIKGKDGEFYLRHKHLLDSYTSQKHGFPGVSHFSHCVRKIRNLFKPS